MPTNLYEAMFVIDASRGGSDFPEFVRLIAGMLTRHAAEIQRLERWDERKLAYPIGDAKRGIYVLTYFNADGESISEIRRDAQLSEDILRVLILRPDEVSPVQGDLYNAEGEQIERPAEPVGAVAESEGSEDAESEEAESDDEE